MPRLDVDLMSQPCRACVIFCMCNNLPVEVKHIRLDKGEHRKPDYLALNPLGKVPFLTDGELRLPESTAILCYLSTKYSCPQTWCPPSSDLIPRAAFDSALHWFHLGIRVGDMQLVFNRVLAPVFGLPLNPAVAANGERILKEGLKQLEVYWLKSGDKPFMVGNSVSIPDLLVACELDQLRLLAGAPQGAQMDELLAPFPAVRAWRARVRSACGEGHWEAACEVLSKAEQRFRAVAAEAQGGGPRL